MADRVDQLIDNVIAREGGYSNNAADAGGPTKYGITLATLHAWRKAPVSAADVAQLTHDEAHRIYRQVYFEGPGFGAISDPLLQELLFDYAANSGPIAAAKSLQTVLQHWGLYKGAIDGAIGPVTKMAIAGVNNRPALYYALKCERYELLLRYVGSDARQAQFAGGWSNRLDQFEDAPTA